jgi:hypothetical protein
MTTLFDDSEFDTSDSSVDEPEYPAQEIRLSEDQSSDEEDVLLEQDVEQRLEVATLYRAFLNMEGLFDVDSPSARMVHRSFKNFARTELKRLMGLGAPPVPVAAVDPHLGFTEDEFKALKSLAARVLSPKTATSNAQPAVRTVTVQPSQHQKPTALKAQAPAQPVRNAQPKPVQRTSPPNGIKTLPGKPLPLPPDKIIEDTENKEGDRLVTVRKRGRLIQQTISPKGRVLATNDITPQMRAPGSIPMPQGEAFTVATQQSAIATASAFGASPTINTIEE